MELFGSCRVWLTMRVCGSYEDPPGKRHLTERYQVVCSACCQVNGEARPSIDQVLNVIEQL